MLTCETGKLFICAMVCPSGIIMYKSYFFFAFVLCENLGLSITSLQSTAPCENQLSMETLKGHVGMSNVKRCNLHVCEL